MAIDTLEYTATDVALHQQKEEKKISFSLKKKQNKESL